MQDESINEKRIRKNKEYLKVLVQQWEAASNQLMVTLNQSEKPSIQKTIDDLENQIDELDNKIKKLQLCSLQRDSNKFYNQYSKTWEEEFHKIDFEETRKILVSILEKFKSKEESAALFLLQNSDSMKGDLFIKHIKSELQCIGSLYSPYKYEFLSHQEANISNFIGDLAEKFSVQHYHQIPISTYTDQIINNICASLKNNIFFIQIDICILDFPYTFMDWFVQHFWCKLLGKLPEISQKNPLMRFVAVLSIHDSIPENLLSDLCCETNKFDSKKFLELPLKHWTNEEIQNWLFSFSGLTDPPIGLTPQQIERMAKNIHGLTDEGQPCRVYRKLMDDMSKRVS
jgi:inactive STAND/Effector-associated domain 9